MSEDPWVVFWGAVWKGSRNHVRGSFDGPSPDLDRIKVWQYFQSHVASRATLRCNFYSGPSSCAFAIAG
eukprot:8025198-Pyramimonas_sp.AAC.1